MEVISKRFKVPAYAKHWILIDILGCVAGIVGGLGTVFFKMMITLNKLLFFETLLPSISLDMGSLNPALILLPALGGFLVGPIIMHLAPETKGPEFQR